ncbi:Trk-type pottasium transport system, membrane component [Thermococcus onnurineus NA1]|uniref:Trk-type pottasium transport system, membrane component n=1 Tax=Thermococcus onnurineus (strain NA1) TaxID=523850 RepID=B6YTG1_THEON|nr:MULTISPECIES: TrkH family potassium uptake protein [Thermococcus]ACJ15848.1 Trk-type pottasium transport system, membrane component [Thermococcus onnurineus NA1]NJE46346.1 TrkH family potassium uptake protein [Thermococcus sp. GR7]NJE77735.1 TrkH family potassium uptake protein [Thermococcus sp. GR4]NJF23775.1 TrkH family potassium uptake protein [Thermococcus sp. GR5]
MLELGKYINISDDLFVVKNLIGAILQGVGLAYLFPILLAWFYPDEIDYVIYFAIPGIFSILLGAWLARHMGKIEDVNLRQAMVSAAFTWLFASFISVVPFMAIGGMSFVDSYFESMSAWTGTGLTMMSNLESYPHILIFWRSWMQWLGGIGIVLVALTILIRPGVAAARLYRAEARSERILPNLVNTSKVIFEIYFVLTLVGVYLYYLNGMPLFDAVIHSMTGLGTGGMSSHDLSIGYFNSTAIEAVTIFLMIMGAVNFTVHYRIFRDKHLKPFFEDVQVRYMFVFLFPTIAVMAFSLAQIGDTIGDALRQAVFHAVSAITCTGFGIADLSKYPELAKFMIGILMVIGGGAGSTAGGIKLIRVTLMYESLKWTIQGAILPRGAIIKRKVGNYIFSDEDVQEVMSFTMTYFAFLLIGTVYTMVRLGTSLVDSFFEVASAQGNVGLSVGITSPSLPVDMKILLILHMWIGRLEIFSTLVFIISVFFLAPRVVGKR